MISRTAEYALRAVVWLSVKPQTVSPGRVIARDTKLPARYLAKVMHDLVRSGVVDPRRGRHGWPLAPARRRKTDGIVGRSERARYGMCISGLHSLAVRRTSRA